ncbi:LapA family protein [Pseudomonas aeruginosa]|uniref:LapA family protein n=1 Tax=Pseudomonas aeruginosa TaxID=287 RepID=UPI0022454898|nr:LapA family protein [Pseudomonas aeruginosa]MCX2518073.1 LapA family protein [Pseudomonas aeruginosa]
MLWIKRVLLGCGLLFVALFVILLTVENQQTTHFKLLGFYSPEFSIVLYMTLAFVLGGFFGLLIGMPLVARMRVRLWAIRKELAKVQRESDLLQAKLIAYSGGTVNPPLSSESV